MVSSSDIVKLQTDLAAAKEAAARANQRADFLAEELRLAKEQNVTVQLQAEREEEAILLKMMRRLEQLKREKAQIVSEVAQEEEFLTNTLQKRMEKLATEKAELEHRVLELKKQTEQLSSEKAKLCKEKIDLEAVLESESEYIVNKLQVQIEKVGTEKLHLIREKTDLQRQVAELAQSVDRLNKDKVKLEQEMEMEEESIVNRLQRQLEVVMHNLRLVETRLEAKGMTLKDLGISHADLVPASETLRIYSRSPSSTSSIDKWGFPSPHSNSGHYGVSPNAHSSGALNLAAHISSTRERHSRERHSSSMSASGGGMQEVLAK